MRYVAGHVVISEQLLNQAIATENAIRAHEARCAADPEYAERWFASVDWDAIEESYEALGDR